MPLRQRAPNERRGESLRQLDVVHEAGSAGEKRRILNPPHTFPTKMATPEKRLVHRLTPHVLAHRSSMNGQLRIEVPRRQTGCVTARCPSADKTFCQIAAGNIEMAEHATQFTCCVKPTNGLIVRVKTR